jgi:hypothetical protein
MGIQRLGFKPGFTISSNSMFCLFYISLHQKVRSFAFVFWKNDESLDVPKETSLFNSKKYTIKLYTQNLCYTKPQVLLLILSFQSLFYSF